MSKNDFFKKLKSAEAALEKAKSAKRSGGLVDVEDGAYIVRWHKSVADVSDKGVPRVLIETRVVQSPTSETAVGSRIAKYHNIEKRNGVYKSGPNKGEAWESTIEDCLANLCKDLQSFGVDTEEIEGMDDLQACLESLDQVNPACRTQVKTKGDYQNVYFGKFLDDDTIPTLEDVLEGEVSGDDDEEEVTEDDGAEEETEEDDSELSEGDEVAVRLPKSKRATSCTIVRFEDDGGIVVADANGTEHTVTESQLVV